jgi:putative transposase
LKKETTNPAANNFLQQQEKFDRFIECYSQERPHQAIEMHYPAEFYRPSERAYHGLDPLEYPFHDRTVAATVCSRVCFGSRRSWWKGRESNPRPRHYECRRSD